MGTRKKLAMLPPQLFEYLQGGHIVVLATVDPEGLPELELITWVLAMDERTVRFVVSANYDAAHNVIRNGSAALQVLGPDIGYAIKGRARLLKDHIEATNFPQILFEMKVEEVYEDRFGATYIAGPIPYRRKDRVEELSAQVGAIVLAEVRAFKEPQEQETNNISEPRPGGGQTQNRR
jgi:hypothetical protein